jgi:adenylate cyclase
MAWANRDPQIALEHAHRAFSLAAKSGNPYLRVYAQACRGLAHTIAGNLNAAIEDLTGALRFARSRKAGLENEARILADLSDAYRLNGDSVTALETVDEAIEVAIARHARAPECRARIVRAEILLGSKTTDKQAAWEELARAKELMRETGAFIYSPIIDALAVEGTRGSQGGSAISIG